MKSCEMNLGPLLIHSTCGASDEPRSRGRELQGMYVMVIVALSVANIFAHDIYIFVRYIRK